MTSFGADMICANSLSEMDDGGDEDTNGVDVEVGIEGSVDDVTGVGILLGCDGGIANVGIAVEVWVIGSVGSVLVISIRSGVVLLCTVVTDDVVDCC